jgi:hypothetical protein
MASLLVGIVVVWSVFMPFESHADSEICDFDGGSIRIYVRWDGSYRCFRWDSKGLEVIKNPSPPDPWERTDVARPLGDERASALPQELFAPDMRLDVPFAVSRNGQLLVSCVHGKSVSSVCQELAVIDRTNKQLLQMIETKHQFRSVTWSPTGKYFGVVLSENVTKQLWKGPLDLLGGFLGHPRSYYDVYGIIYNLKGEVICKRRFMKNLLNGKGYMEWE